MPLTVGHCQFAAQSPHDPGHCGRSRLPLPMFSSTMSIRSLMGCYSKYFFSHGYDHDNVLSHFLYIATYMYVCVYIDIHMYVLVLVYVRVHVHAYLCIRICICICRCVYVYMHMYRSM